MALAVDNVAAEEEESLESLGKRYLKEASIPTWTAAFNQSNDLEVLAEEIPEMHRA